MLFFIIVIINVVSVSTTAKTKQNKYKTEQSKAHVKTEKMYTKQREIEINFDCIHEQRERESVCCEQCVF